MPSPPGSRAGTIESDAKSSSTLRYADSAGMLDDFRRVAVRPRKSRRQQRLVCAQIMCRIAGGQPCGFSANPGSIVEFAPKTSPINDFQDDVLQAIPERRVGAWLRQQPFLQRAMMTS